MKYYKLTNEAGQTYNNTQWGVGITHKATGKGDVLCSEDVIHVYDNPYKAVLFNYTHADFSNPILWKCKVRRVVADDGMKVGVKECTTIKQIPLPQLTSTQIIAFAILCAKRVYSEVSWNVWADGWLSGENRTADAACAARAACDAACAVYAVYAARAACDAADAAIDFTWLVGEALKY